jgi:4-hydroxybenzoate polyprenyltransferase
VEKLVGFLRLMRPANIVTAVADILAGLAIAGFLSLDELTLGPIAYLILATIGLYGGGVVFNDVFDADLDRVERPERPIPRGLISVAEASVLAAILLLGGVACAFAVSQCSGLLAIAIAVAAIVYDKWGKHQPLLGPLNMGLCRGLNLLLGVSIIPDQVEQYWLVGIVPLVYIAAITMVSRGEVHGGSRRTLFFAGVLYALAICTILGVGIKNDQILWPVLLVGAWASMIFIPLYRAIQMPEGKFIGRAVKAGVIALILMDAAWAAAFGFPLLALVIASLLPVSILLARVFAVT